MDESIQPSGGDHEDSSRANEVNSATAFKIAGSMIATVHRLGLERGRRSTAARFAGSAGLESTSDRFRQRRQFITELGRQEKQIADQTKILPMAEAADAIYPGACSEYLAPGLFHRVIEQAERSLLIDERSDADSAAAQGTAQDRLRQEVKNQALSILGGADKLASVTEELFVDSPTLTLTYLEMASKITDETEQTLRELDPDTYMMGRQLLIDAVVMSVDAFNVAALEIQNS